MERSLEEEKHELALLVELILYNQVRSISEGKVLDRQKRRRELIDEFIEENIDRFESIPYDEYVRYINFVLERTEKNVNRIKNQKSDDREI